MDWLIGLTVWYVGMAWAIRRWYGPVTADESDPTGSVELTYIALFWIFSPGLVPGLGILVGVAMVLLTAVWVVGSVLNIASYPLRYVGMALTPEGLATSKKES